MYPDIFGRTIRLAAGAGAIAFSSGCADGTALTAPTAPRLGDRASLGASGGGGGSVVTSIVGLEPLLDAAQNFGQALHVSDLGQVVGTSATNTIASYNPHAVIWDGSSFAQDLGTLGGALTSVANGIHPNGSVIVGGSGSSAVRWVKLNGVWTIDALPEPEGSDNCSAVDIASDGTIAGSCVVSGLSHVIIWRNGIATDLGQGSAQAINKNGQILVGVLIGGNNQSVIWDTRTSPVTVTNIGSLGGPTTSARDMNDNGDVVGTSRNAALAFRPFLWTAKKGMVELGTLSGSTSATPQAINNAGQIVGSDFDGTLGRAVIWNRGRVFDLGVLPGYQSSTAMAINAAGLVVGFSTFEFEGTITDFRATVWTLK